MAEFIIRPGREAQFRGVNPALMAILKEAAARAPPNISKVELFSGQTGRSTGTVNHPAGRAVDVQLYDAAGKPLDNYLGSPYRAKSAAEKAAFSVYEQFAQSARIVQQEKYPELSNAMRWGGYFKGGVNPGDSMHFDMSGGRSRGTPVQTALWEKGLGTSFSRGAGSVRVAAATPPKPPTPPSPEQLAYVNRPPDIIGNIMGLGAGSLNTGQTLLEPPVKPTPPASKFDAMREALMSRGRNYPPDSPVLGLKAPDLIYEDAPPPTPNFAAASRSPDFSIANEASNIPRMWNLNIPQPRNPNFAIADPERQLPQMPPAEIAMGISKASFPPESPSMPYTAGMGVPPASAPRTDIYGLRSPTPMVAGRPEPPAQMAGSAGIVPYGLTPPAATPSPVPAPSVLDMGGSIPAEAAIPSPGVMSSPLPGLERSGIGMASLPGITAGYIGAPPQPAYNPLPTNIPHPVAPPPTIPKLGPQGNGVTIVPSAPAPPPGWEPMDIRPGAKTIQAGELYAPPVTMAPPMATQPRRSIFGGGSILGALTGGRGLFGGVFQPRTSTGKFANGSATRFSTGATASPFVGVGGRAYGPQAYNYASDTTPSPFNPHP